MTCPHCQAGFLPEGARRCPLCGQLRSGSQTAVSVDVAPENTVPADDFSAVDDIVSAELGAQFRIGRPLKHGRATHVYFAHDASGGGGRETALKVIVLPAGVAPADTARFQQAANAAAGLDHPNIARPYRHGTTDKLWWYATDYVPAPSVAQRLAAAMGRPLDVPLTLRLALQIASALDYAHRRGIVHGALKPADVLLDDAGWVRVVDTGLAQAIRAIAALGSAENGEAGDDPASTYLAPECFTSARPVGPLADQYSLALIVRECLTGTPPRAAAAQATQGGLSPGVEPHAAQVLQRALAQAPGHRFVGVLDFVGALTGGAPQPSGLAPRSPPRGRPRPVLLFEPEQRPRRRFYRLGVALALTASGGVLWVAAQSTQVPRVPSSYGAPPVRTPAPVTAVAPPAPSPPPAQPQPSVPVPPKAQPRRVVPAAPVPGFLSVSARPWAVLSVDGRLIGNTPKVKVRLLPGVHQFRLQRVGFKTYEAAVEVKPGETVSITNITLTATSP